MEREIVLEGATVEEALDAALEELGVQQDAVEYEVLEEPGRGAFGFGSKPARVRVTLKREFLDELESAQAADADEPAEAAGPPAEPEIASVSEEELDAIADEAVSAIQNVLSGFGIEASVEEYEGDDGELILDVTGEDLGVLIGRHGRTLDALQTLVAAITRRKTETRYPLLVDVEGYRFRRKVKLEEIGRNAADRAARQRRAVKLRPMSSYERKVVHMSLRNDQRVTTASEGEEPFRQVVVTPR